MTFDDDFRELEDQLRELQPIAPSPELQQRISRELAGQTARRARRWPWLAAAAGLLGALCLIAASFFSQPRGSLPPVAQPIDVTAWTYTIAAHRSSDDLFRLLDEQAASRRRAGPVTAAPIALALIRQTETNR